MYIATLYIISYQQTYRLNYNVIYVCIFMKRYIVLNIYSLELMIKKGVLTKPLVMARNCKFKI